MIMMLQCLRHGLKVARRTTLQKSFFLVYKLTSKLQTNYTQTRRLVYVMLYDMGGRLATMKNPCP
jgi:hypothetical protein